MFALSDLGEIYGLGGRDLWWWKLEQESVWANDWRGNTTERSQLMLTTINTKEGDEKMDENTEVTGFSTTEDMDQRKEEEEEERQVEIYKVSL